MHATNADATEVKCLSWSQIVEKGSLSISTRDPHPYVKDRELEIENWLNR